VKRILALSILTSMSLYGVSNEYLLQQLKQMQTKLNKLEKENKQFKQQIKSLKSQVNDNSNYIEEVDDNVGSLTANVIKNTRIGITRLKFDTTAHNFYYKTADGKSHHNKNVDTLNLKLDLEKQISNKLRFRGQLSMYKYFSQGDYYPNASYDNMQGRVPADSALYVTRAYIDYKVLDGKIPTILTIGRQPSSSGPSWQYSNNGVRYGTYDALVFDGNADGVVATMLFDKVSSLKNSALRFAYGKGFQNNGFTKDKDNGLTDTNVYGVFFESQIPSIKDSFMQVFYSTAQNIQSQGTIIGDIHWIGAMAEFNKINNFDFFFHYAMSKAKPNGNIASTMIGDAGLLTNTKGDTSTKTGSAVWVGARYSFDNKSKIGLEYGYGSKNWINMTQGSDNILNPRSVRGSVWDLYGIYPIDTSLGVNAFIKVGATLIDYKYSNSGMPYATPIRISSSMDDADKTTDELQDYYLDFQVNY